MITFDIEAIPREPRPKDPSKMKEHKAKAKNPLTLQIISIVASRWDPEDLLSKDPFEPDTWRNVDVFRGYARHGERQLIHDFNDWRRDDGFTRHSWCAHNLLKYDGVALAVRAASYNEPKFDALAKDVSCLRTWGDDWHRDTAQLFGPGAKYVSLASCAEMFGIPYLTAGGGADVFDWYWNGRWDFVMNHNNEDVSVLNMFALRLMQSGLMEPPRESRRNPAAGQQSNRDSRAA